MRVKGMILLILGVVLVAVSFLLLGDHDVKAIIGALVMALGGASLLGAFVELFGEKPRMQ